MHGRPQPARVAQRGLRGEDHGVGVVRHLEHRLLGAPHQPEADRIDVDGNRVEGEDPLGPEVGGAHPLIDEGLDPVDEGDDPLDLVDHLTHQRVGGLVSRVVSDVTRLQSAATSDVAALLANAKHPDAESDGAMLLNATTGLCFEPTGRYTIEAVGKVLDAANREERRLRVRRRWWCPPAPCSDRRLCRRR